MQNFYKNFGHTRHDVDSLQRLNWATALDLTEPQLSWNKNVKRNSFHYPSSSTFSLWFFNQNCNSNRMEKSRMKTICQLLFFSRMESLKPLNNDAYLNCCITSITSTLHEDQQLKSQMVLDQSKWPIWRHFVRFCGFFFCQQKRMRKAIKSWK